jgi:hypothetical protein
MAFQCVCTRERLPHWLPACESECGGSYSMVRSQPNQYYNNYRPYSTRKNVMKFENLDCKSYYPELFSFYSILLLHDLNGKRFLMILQSAALALVCVAPCALSSAMPQQRFKLKMVKRSSITAAFLTY